MTVSDVGEKDNQSKQVCQFFFFKYFNTLQEPVVEKRNWSDEAFWVKNSSQRVP